MIHEVLSTKTEAHPSSSEKITLEGIITAAFRRGNQKGKVSQSKAEIRKQEGKCPKPKKEDILAGNAGRKKKRK